MKILAIFSKKEDNKNAGKHQHSKFEEGKMANTDTGCIFVLCGLPASGKSTLIHQIQNDLKDQLEVIIVEYDHLMPAEVEKILITETTSKSASKWKMYRQQIVECVDLLLENLCKVSVGTEKPFQHSSKPVAVNSDLWLKFQDICRVGLNDKSFSVARKPFVIIIDDNMYYRSMRYQYYQLARKYTIGFCELYVDCSVETAITRNSDRKTGKVHEDTIYSMGAHFERPCTDACRWEKYSLILSPSTSLSEIQFLILNALKDPVKPLPVEDVEEKGESREACSASFIHQADQVLRKLVAKEMIAAKASGMSAEKLKKMAAELAESRLRILKDMKSGVVTSDFTAEIKDASKDSNSELYKFITSIFSSSKITFEKV